MKKNIKKIMSVLAAGVLVLGLAGCGQGNQGGEEGQKSTGNKVGMVISTLNNPFFVSMQEGAQAKAKEMGYDLIVLDSQNDPAKERSNVEDLVQQGVSVLIVNPTDSDAVANSIQIANDANIPVITVDRQSNGGEVISHIASDNVKGGEMAANYILEQLKDKSEIKVVELQGTPGTSAARERGQGFHNVIDKQTNVKVVASQAADFDRTKGLTVMENIIQAQPEFDVVFAHNDEMALGAVKAIKTANKNVMVIGFDGNDDAKDAVQKGDMTATVAQQPSLMGSTAVENAVKVIKGETIEKQIPVELQFITK
ncbi:MULTISPECIES: ribose ABC transporter substrate-binding protein RbsB [Clostridium]|jgi:ribose transport system substrate-binding protein|uniref:D-ribose-binding periplasmic protein n=2 Tax=Clostridium TaxID=1485 RepID=A0A151ANQ6_9CLOT|nr:MULTISPECIES: ribose ABC transporter substrate-binding protein RbsB [Clostridium]KYH29037.1 D-ribose-binding periplasmic protein precursor [Clostridium colicanis DSM 13634]MBE6043408.1 ribose ABC transporter substrate-binding protein RbsB [Clostridium thermopalmarium]PRR73658.1 D-ribose-binding periplasmic protein precursor [Clostridium thermopalmarium DSM 5974]PVZ21044.1 ribose-binding protein [Clostridium thermopalmarium DSM 5974]